MKNIWLVSSLSVIGVLLSGSTQVNAEKTYNILSIDGGGIRGIIPAGVLLHVESFAMEYAKEKGYSVPKYTDADGKVVDKVHLKDLFDMVAGTSTGSIISAAIAYPLEADKDKPA